MAARSIQLLLRVVAHLAVLLAITMAVAWGSAAIVYSYLWQSIAGSLALTLLVVSALAALYGIASGRWRTYCVGGFVVVFLGVIAWWSTIEPSNDRDWKTEVAVLPEVSWNGDHVTVRNIRNFNYRTPTDFDADYYDNTFDLDELESLDLIASYWAGPAIAHIFVSFGFSNGDHLAVSIERRDERGEGYSTIKGLFKQYEIFFVVADERDVLRLRTNIRNDPPEDVYLYRVQAPLENGRRLFVEYMRRIESLKTQPEFYNTITSNCAGNVWLNASVNPGRVPFSWKILLSGHVPEYLHERGLLDKSMPFQELQQRSRINDRARAVDDPADYSHRIRAGMSGTPVD